MPHTLPDFRGKRVLVMGLGRFGGGVGVSRFLASRGAKVLVTDKDPASKLTASVAQLRGTDVEFRLGEHRVEDFASADVLVVNPAVKPEGNIYLDAAKKAGVFLTSEIRMLIASLPNPRRVVGITGSAGKSTTTAMVGHALTQLYGAGRVHVGGNLGGTLLGATIAPDDFVVLELSSFMLDAMREDQFAPHVALLTNITQNHLDRHGTLEAYADAKRVLFEHQGPGDHALFGPGAMDHMRFPAGRPPAGRVTQILAPAEDIDLLIPGEHNKLNAAFALAIAEALGFPRDAAKEALGSFAGLEHRLRLVCEHAGVRYFNDSKATTPEAAMLAMQSFPQGTVHVILGGSDKGADLSPMAELAARHCHALYTVGATGPAIADAAERAAERMLCESEFAQRDPANAQRSCGGTAGGACLPASVVRCQSIDDAVRQTVPRIRRGDVVLLSPGCASYGMFEHFEQRGAAFVEAVLKYTGEDAPSPRP